MVNAAGHTINTIGVHGVIPHGGRGYAASLDAGFALLDISDGQLQAGRLRCAA